MALPAAIAGAVGRAAVSGGASGAATGAVTGSATAGRAVSQLGNLSIATNQLGMSAQRAHHWVADLGDIITGRLAKALTMWIGFVEKAAAPIASLVQVANPARVQAFTRAIQDAYGVVGRLLIPVMDAFTGIARKVGNLMASLEPTFQPAIRAIAKLIEAIGTTFVNTVSQNGPVFEMMAFVIERVAQAATVLVQVLGEVWQTFGRIIQRLVAFTGFFTGESMDKNRTAVGAAARNARFVQPKEIADDALKNALMMGVGAKEPEKTTKDVWQKIKEVLDYLEKRFGQVDKAEGVVAGMAVAPVETTTTIAGRAFRYALARGR